MTIDRGGENVFPTHPLASYSLYSNKEPRQDAII